MKIYAFGMSAPSRFVMAVCKHVNIPFEPVDVDLTSQEQKSEAHVKRNPNGKVPVMEEGDFTLFESLAIVRYLLDSKVPGNTLFPTDPKTRAKINQVLGGLNDLRGGQFVVTAGKVILPRMGKSMPDQILHHAEEQYKGALAKINGLLEGKTFAVGDHATIVDFLFAEVIMNAAMIKTNFDDYPNIKKYYEHLLATIPELKEDAENVKDIIEMLSGSQ